MYFSITLKPVSLSVLKSPELKTALQVWPHHCCVDLIPRRAVNALPNAAHDTISLLCHKGILLAHSQWTSLGPLASFETSWLSPSMYWTFLLRCRALQFSSLNLMKFLLAPNSNPSRVLWMASQPSHLSATPPDFCHFQFSSLSAHPALCLSEEFIASTATTIERIIPFKGLCPYIHGNATQIHCSPLYFTYYATAYSV